MTGHDAHLAVIAAGSVAKDRREATHCPRSRVPDVIRRVDVTEQHEAGLRLQDALPQSAASHQLHLVALTVGRVEDTVGRAVSDEDV